ncbi:DNA-protecting protein DprA, partial [Georgenia sp. 10Sc9-8]|nr:DNA-protecting protein DprA [Georgenia halotolerans]
MATELPFDATDPRLAAAAWSRLVEPGDVVAGTLVAQHGVVEALDRLVRAVHRAGAPVDLDVDAVARWAPRLQTLDIRRELTVLDRLGGR